jgi:hypothetical protein
MSASFGRLVGRIVLVCVVSVFVPSIVCAQNRPAPSPLPPPEPPESHEVALGVKGGLIFASLGDVDPFNNPISNSLGATIGVFVGSNNAGRFGIVAEALYNRRTAEQTDNPANKLNLYSLEIPMLMRINLGAPNPNGFRIYFVAGPGFDVLLKSQLAGQDISENYQGFNVNAIAGGGVEFKRFLAEIRADYGLRSATNGNFANQAKIYTQTIVGMVGYRFK